MKLFSTTYDDKERTKEINALVGKPISFLNAIRMGGKGSSRMLVDEVSSVFEHMMNRLSNVNYSSIEIRPKGIIVFLVQAGLKSWAWVIPYEQLKMDDSEGLKIASGMDYVVYRNDRHLRQNVSFIKKIKQERDAYLNKVKGRSDII